MGGDLSSRSVLVWHCGDTETFVFGFLYPGIWGCQKSESGGISWTLRMSKVWVWRHICDSEDVKSLSLEAYLWLWGCQKSESGGIYWTLRMSEVWVWRQSGSLLQGQGSSDFSVSLRVTKVPYDRSVKPSCSLCVISSLFYVRLIDFFKSTHMIRVTCWRVSDTPMCTIWKHKHYMINICNLSYCTNAENRDIQVWNVCFRRWKLEQDQAITH